MARDFINGKEGVVTYDGTDICVTSWELDLAATELDTTNVCDGVYGSFIAGPVIVTGTVNAYLDTSDLPTGANINLQIGTKVTIACEIGNTGKSYSGPGRIMSLKTTNNAKEVVAYSFTFKSAGEWTLPS